MVGYICRIVWGKQDFAILNLSQVYASKLKFTIQYLLFINFSFKTNNSGLH